MGYYQNIWLDWTTWKEVATDVGTTKYYLDFTTSYVPFVADTTNQFIYATTVYRDPSASGPYAPLSAGVKANVVIQDITYTANAYGTSGNSITIQYVNDAVATGQEYVTVSGLAITVHIVSGSSTPQLIVNAVTAYNGTKYGSITNAPQASGALVSALVTGNGVTPQTTTGPTNLASGANAVTVLSDFNTNFLSSSTLVSSFPEGIGINL